MSPSGRGGPATIKLCYQYDNIGLGNKIILPWRAAHRIEGSGGLSGWDWGCIPRNPGPTATHKVALSTMEV